LKGFALQVVKSWNWSRSNTRRKARIKHKLEQKMSHPSLLSAATDHPVLHSQIEANGASFHVVEQGLGPVVLFLHGFPDTVET
jgi:hypothetical protein